MADERHHGEDIAGLIPHSGVARFLSGIVSVTPSTIHATGVIPAGHPLATTDVAPAFLAIELGAQAAAALEALSRRSSSTGDNRPKAGTLVRIRDARFGAVSVPLETPIHVTAERTGAALPLAMYRISASLGDATILTAVISTHASPERGTP